MDDAWIRLWSRVSPKNSYSANQLAGAGKQMESMLFEIRVCINPQCGMRYSIALDQGAGKHCPNCRSATRRIGEPYGQLAVSETGVGAAVQMPRVEVLLDNIRSAWNVGAIFRSADGAGVEHVHLCGVCPKPDHPKVAKTALGSEQSVAWSFHPDGEQACQEMKKAGYRLWALEGGPGAENLYRQTFPQDRPLLLVVGNEVSGVEPGILALCERVVCLPMLGTKGSLNVAVACGIALYALRFNHGSA